MLVNKIKRKIINREYVFSKHAVDQSIIRNISVDELEETISGKSEIIENYPNDKYGPSCLILGFTKKGRPLHVQCTYPHRPLVKIITLYEPTKDLWLNFKTRKNQ